MYKNSILIFIFLFSFQAISAQKIFYSEKLNDRFDFNRSYVIGKVKNNIIVLKYGESFKKPELLIYDYNMHFKGNVPFDVINSGVLAKMDFVIRGNIFDAIIQYYTSNNFYCKIARFNDEGQLVNAIQTIDSVNTKRKDGAEIYHVVKSENNEQVILMRSFMGIKPNCLQLEYKFINNRFKIDQEKKYLVPFNDDIQLSPFYLDNSGDLLFCEFIPGSSDQNAILFYKILKHSDNAINSVQFIGSNRPAEMAITIDNNKKEYLLNGLFYETPDEDLVTATFAQSIYSCLFNDDLVITGKDTTIEIQKVDGLEAAALNSMLLVNSGNSNNNNGYYVTCAGMKSAYLNISDIGMNYQSYETPDYAAVEAYSQFYRQPYPFGQPTEPIYYNGFQTYRGNFFTSNSGSMVSHFQPNYIKEKNPGLLLLTMHINNENKFEWVRILNDSIGNNYYSVTNISQGIATQNLHFIFSEQFGKNKKIISELVVSRTGEHYTKDIVLNDLHYDIQLDKGVQIDDKSMVFPCNVKERLGFVRIEFD